MQLPQILYFTLLEALSAAHVDTHTYSCEHVHMHKHTPYMSHAQLYTIPKSNATQLK